MSETLKNVDVDISREVPKAKRRVIFQENEQNDIRDNFGKYTREGVEKKIELWTKSSNRPVQVFYKTMLVQCKNLKPSAKTKSGLIIYSYNEDGSANWTQDPKELKVDLDKEVALATTEPKKDEVKGKDAKSA